MSFTGTAWTWITSCEEQDESTHLPLVVFELIQTGKGLCDDHSLLGRFYTPADSRQCIHAPCSRELLCLSGSFHSFHMITYLDNTANTPFFMPCPFSSVGLQQIQVFIDIIFSCSVITSQHDVAVCLLCRILAQFLVDQGPQLSQILTGNKKTELHWKENRDGQTPSFSGIISDLMLRLEPRAPWGPHTE